jgi:hypothetical protein
MVSGLAIDGARRLAYDARSSMLSKSGGHVSLDDGVPYSTESGAPVVGLYTYTAHGLGEELPNSQQIVPDRATSHTYWVLGGPSACVGEGVTA